MIGWGDLDYEDEDDAVNQDHGMVTILVTDTVHTDPDGVCAVSRSLGLLPREKGSKWKLGSIVC
jgi:hypothetical protein